jgi:zinc D-Ala-D-Ala carboxypeptidase
MQQKRLSLNKPHSPKSKLIPKNWLVVPVALTILIIAVLLSQLNNNVSAPTNSQPVNSSPIIPEDKPIDIVVSSSSITTSTTSASSTSSSSKTTSTTSANSGSILNCGDCWLAPVDKTHALKSSYAPAVVATELPGGNWKVTVATKPALKDLFAAALAQGIQAEIASGYRSYKDQETAFNYWVNQEMTAGYDRPTATQRANVYSAKPGHSEHQLGTTVDLKAKNNEAFTETPGNNALYEFILMNAHKYGFVVSYPEGKENFTGYKYEPWHIRYIGKSLAQELFNKNYLSASNQIYLAQFLRDKGN